MPLNFINVFSSNNPFTIGKVTSFSLKEDKEPQEDKIGTIHREKLDDVLSKRRTSTYSLPSIDRQVLTVAQKIDCWIAGGAALSLYAGDLKIKDWDLFFKSHDLLVFAKADFLNEIRFFPISRLDEEYEKADFC